MKRLDNNLQSTDFHRTHTEELILFIFLVLNLTALFLRRYFKVNFYAGKFLFEQKLLYLLIAPLINLINLTKQPFIANTLLAKALLNTDSVTT